mgnify:CR=1 FL=1
MLKYILTIVYLLFTTTGITLMKLGGNTLSLGLKNGISFKIGYVTTLGFLCYIVSFLLWQKLLVTYDLSRIVPITTGISQILIIIIGILVFKENVSMSSWIGIILIISGVVVTSLSR